MTSSQSRFNKTSFKTKREFNAQNINRSIEKSIVFRLYDNEKNKFTSKNKYVINYLCNILYRDNGFLTDFAQIKKNNLPKISSPARAAMNRKMPIDYSKFFKSSTIKTNNFKDIPNSDFSKTMNGFGRSKMTINMYNRK